MTQLSSATSLFFKLDANGNRVPNQLAVFTIASDGTYEIQHGTECKVCETNAVVVIADSRFRSGEIKVSMVCGETSHWVKNTFAIYATPQSVDELNGLLSFTLFEDKSVDESPLEQPWPHLDRSQNHQSTTTLTSSMSAESYVSTAGTSGVFICHASELGQACGHLGHAGLSYNVVMFATPAFYASPAYKDAKPFAPPIKFLCETQTNPQQNVGGILTQPTTAGCTSLRLGRLDRYASEGTEERDGPPCDHNAMTLRQYQAISFIPSTSSVFKYGNKLRISFAGNPAYVQPAVGINAPGTILFSFSQTTGVLSGTTATLSGTVDALAWALGNNTFELTNELPDGRKTYPHEWHFFGDVPAVELQTELPQPPSQLFNNGGVPGQAEVRSQSFVGANRQSQAESFIAQAQSDIAQGFYQVAVQRFVKPKKLQLQISATQFSTFCGFGARVTFLQTYKIYKAPMSIFSIGQNDSPNTQILTVSIAYGFAGDWQFACEREYLGEQFANTTINISGANNQSAAAAFWNGQQVNFSTSGLVGNWQLT